MEDDQDLYLKMDGFRKPPPPIPRLNENRRHSEIPWTSNRPDFGSVVAAFQESSISQPPGRPSNYPRVNLRNEISRPVSNHQDPPPPPRPAKPSFAIDHSTRNSHRPQIDEPPPRPYKPSYDDGFVPVSPRNDPSRPALPSHGPPIEDRPLHAAPPPRPYAADQPPPVLPRQDFQDDSELYLMIDNNTGLEPELVMESTSPLHGHGRDAFDGSHNMQTKQFQLPPHPSTRSNFPSVPKKPFPDVSHHDHLGHPEPKPRNMATIEPRSVSPSPVGFGRSPIPTPMAALPSRKGSGKGSQKNNLGSEAIQRRKSSQNRNSIGSPTPQRTGSNQSQNNFAPEMPQRNGSNRSQTSTSSSDNLDEDRPGHDYQPRKQFQEIKKSFGDTPFRPPPSIPSSNRVLPPMSTSTAPPSGGKSLPIMKLPSPSESSRPSSTSTELATSPVKTGNKNVDEQAWYRNVTRQAAVHEIEQNMQEGCFIVRPGKGQNKPYSLTVCSDSTMYNLHIRRREDGNYALGLPKENERSFPNTVDLIEYYMETELVLAGNKGSVVLTGPP